MKPAASPYPPRWVGASLESAGLGEVRPPIGTYGEYDFDLLPPAPTDLRGDWEWLFAQQEGYDHIGDASDFDPRAVASTLRASAALVEAKLPKEFLTFIETPTLHRRIRSCTYCRLDIGQEAVPSPLDCGLLFRFLADSQGCVFWYLHVNADGSDHAVVYSPDFYGTPEEAEGWGEEQPDPSRIAFAAESFEAFMWRFWLESEIWHACHSSDPMPAAGARYVEEYLARAAKKASDAGPDRRGEQDFPSP